MNNYCHIKKKASAKGSDLWHNNNVDGIIIMDGDGEGIVELCCCLAIMGDCCGAACAT